MVSAVPGSLVVCESGSAAIAFFSVEFSSATANFGAFSAGGAARSAVTPAIRTRATMEHAKYAHGLVLTKRRLRSIEPSQIVWTWKGRLSGPMERTGVGRGLAGNIERVARAPRPREGSARCVALVARLAGGNAKEIGRASCR